MVTLRPLRLEKKVYEHWYFLQMSWVGQHPNRLAPFQDLSEMMETVELREFIFLPAYTRK